MMKNLVIGIVAVMVIAGAGYFIYNSQNSGNQQMVLENNNQGEMVQENGNMTFSDFMKKGGSYMCTITQNVEGVTSQGTVYISGDMVRGEFSSQIDGKDYQSHLIVKDGYSYVWSIGSGMDGTGFKTKSEVKEDNSDNAMMEKSGQNTFNADQVTDYNCSAWTADSSKFNVPSDINFVDTSSMMNY